MIKWRPTTYDSHFLTAYRTTNISFTYVGRPKCFGPKALLEKAIGLPCCIKIAPIPVPDASHSIMNCNEKSRRAKIRAYDSFNFKILNASSAALFQPNEFLRSNSVKGRAIFP